MFKRRFGEATRALKRANQDREVDGKLALPNWNLTRSLMPSLRA